MNTVTLTKSRARSIILHAAGLCKRGQFGKGREAVYKVIDHLLLRVGVVTDRKTDRIDFQ